MNSWFPTFRRLANTRVPFPSWRPGRTTLGQRRSALRLIAVATEEKLPLSPLIEAWAADERGVQKHRLHRLAGLLKDGTPLPDAVEQIPGVLRDEDILAIRFDAQSGTLTAAVRQVLEEFQPTPASGPSRFRQTMIYVCTVLLVAFLIVTFLQIEIVPEFNKIAEEFQIEQPAVLHWSQHLAVTFTNFWWLGALALVVLLWSTFSARPGRFVRHMILGRFYRPWRELRSAEVLHKLSVAARAGRPVPGALSTLARYHFDPTTRHKLLFVRNEVEQGADVWQSMTAVGLLTPPEVRLLKTAERVGNRPWALKQLAQGKKRRTSRRLGRMSELLLPAIVLVMGGFVLFQALTIFLPLTQFIYGLL